MASCWRFTKRTIGPARIHTSFHRFTEIGRILVIKMLSKLKSGKCWTRLASYPLQYGNWPWWNNPPIYKPSSQENGTGQYPDPHGKGTLGPEFKSTKIPGRARISAVLFSPTILDAFYGFKKVWFFYCSPPHSFQSERYRLTWDGKCETSASLYNFSA